MTATIESREPARPSQIVATFEVSDAAMVDAQIERATSAAREWRSDAAARARALHQWADSIESAAGEFIDTTTREVGKPVRETKAELTRAISIIRYYAQAAYDPIAETYPGADAATELTVHRRPLGVVSVLCPWNFPIAIPAWKIAPALAYGNTVLFRPSSLALATASLLIRTAILTLPDGVLQLVVSDHAGSTALVDDPRVGAVTFTGSVAVGMNIVQRAAGRGVPVQAEMGGQNASIVLDDADLDLAAETIAHAAMDFAGQKCTATRRVIVHRSVAPSFIPQLAAQIEAIKVGMPDDESTSVGPVISAHARESVIAALTNARSRGARQITAVEHDFTDGWFVAPQLLELNDPLDDFAQSETFGPAAAVLIADTDDQAVEIANATRYGLAGAVFSRDITRARSLAARLETGLQRVNAPTTGVDFYVPFGGEKASGYGAREQGNAAREFFTHTRTMLVHSGR